MRINDDLVNVPTMTLSKKKYADSNMPKKVVGFETIATQIHNDLDANKLENNPDTNPEIWQDTKSENNVKDQSQNPVEILNIDKQEGKVDVKKDKKKKKKKDKVKVETELESEILEENKFNQYPPHLDHKTSKKELSFEEDNKSDTEKEDAEEMINKIQKQTELDLPNENVREKRPVISKDYSAEAITDVKYTKYDKDEDSITLIKKALNANDFIMNVMDDDRLNAVVEAMHPEDHEEGSFIIREGEQGSHLFVSAEGSFEVIKDGKTVKLIGPGEVFGELAILYKSKRFASIKVTKKAKVWVLERNVFKKIMFTKRKQEQENNLKFLSRVPILEGIQQADLIILSDLLKRQFFLAGMKIVTQGEKGDSFYIVRGGTVVVTKRPPEGGPEEFVTEISRGKYFGEQALLHEDRRLATVTAKAPGAECLVLDRISFHKYLGNIKELREKRHVDARPSNSLIDKTPGVISSEYKHIKLHELEIIGTLGEGAFGRVELVQYSKKKSSIFALKCLKKIDVLQQKNQERAYNEKNIMLRCNSPFVCKLYNTYKDRKYVYFLIEPLMGGDVWSIMATKRSLEEPIARFMAACVVEALEHLHGMDIIYRDLKPENLMVDSKGYVKVVDFGCSKFLAIGSKTDTVVGTPEYLAPELIKNIGHDRAVDYWALGILIHELLLGKPPFRHQNPSKTLKLIIKGIDHIEFDLKINEAAKSLIKQLCRPVPVERLGYAKYGFQDLKKHIWFSGFKWEKLQARKLKSPFIPPLKKLGKYPEIELPPDETSGWDVHF